MHHNKASRKSPTLLDEALAYYARGWCILPARGKVPACRWANYQSQRPDEDELRELFAQRGLTGLGVLPGAVSGGLAVRDFDTLAGYRQWAAKFPKTAGRLPTVRTSRGRHVFFVGPEGFEDFGDGEYRGDPRHFCVLPPSVHPTGKRYEWLILLPNGALPSVEPGRVGLLSPPPPRGQVTRQTLNKAHQTLNKTEHNTTIPNTTHPIEVSPVPYCSVSDAPCSVSHTVTPPVGGGVERVIRATLPTETGQRNRALFEFARRLKALPEYRDVPLPHLIPLVQRWHEAALPTIGTKDFDTTLRDFANAWKKVTDPAKGCFVEALFEEVKCSPPHPLAKQFPDEGHRLLVGLCAALQRYNGAKPFALSCRVAARLLGIDFALAHKWLRTLESLGILKRVSTGSMARRRANRYRFLADD